MHLLETTPAPCLCCGKGNTPDANGDKLMFVDLERDVNWNDPAILCEDCIARAGGLVGMASKEMLETAKREVSDKDKELHGLKSDMDSMQRRARKLGISFTEKVPA